MNTVLFGAADPIFKFDLQVVLVLSGSKKEMQGNEYEERSVRRMTCSPTLIIVCLTQLSTNNNNATIFSQR
jgi:hypothetical protein